MSENLRKLIGLAVMAAIVVIGVVVTSGDDTDFTRNRSFRDNPVTFAGADRAAEKDVESQILTSLGTLEYRTNNLEIALADMAEDLEKMSNIVVAGRPQIEAFADMVTSACFDMQSVSTQFFWEDFTQIAAGLKVLGPNIGNDFYLYRLDIEREFRDCVSGWLVGMTPQDAIDVVSYFGWDTRYTSASGKTVEFFATDNFKRPDWLNHPDTPLNNMNDVCVQSKGPIEVASGLNQDGEEVVIEATTTVNKIDLDELPSLCK